VCVRDGDVGCELHDEIEHIESVTLDLEVVLTVFTGV